MKQSEERKSLREMNEFELVDTMNKARQDLFKFRTDLAMRSLSNVKAIRTTRKRVARILTIARERDMASSEEQK